VIVMRPITFAAVNLKARQATPDRFWPQLQACVGIPIQR
jgi:hypothetical protein